MKLILGLMATLLLLGCESDQCSADSDCATSQQCRQVGGLFGAARCAPTAGGWEVTARPDNNCESSTCASLGAQCGTVLDACGAMLQCGDCADAQFCGGDAPNQCGDTECVPTTCAALGAECGLTSDGCSAVLDCGSCPVGDACRDGTCEACAPTRSCLSEGITCGTLADDGCGQSQPCGNQMDTDGDGALDCEDCDILDHERAPSLTEICDLVDNDCDGEIDEGCCPESMSLLALETSGVTHYVCVSEVQPPAAWAAAETHCNSLAPPGGGVTGGSCLPGSPLTRSVYEELGVSGGTWDSRIVGTSVWCVGMNCGGTCRPDGTGCTGCDLSCEQPFVCMVRPYLDNVRANCSDSLECGRLRECVGGTCTQVGDDMCCTFRDCGADNCRIVALDGVCEPD